MIQNIALRKMIWVIKALRITEWKAYVGMVIYGVLLSSNNPLDLLRTLPTLPIAIFLYMSSAYLANNVFDIEGDRLNKRKSLRNPFTNDSFSRIEGLTMVLITCSLGITLVTIMNFLASVSYIIGLLLALMYSIPPIRLKERAPLDLISHSIFFGVALVLFGFHLNGDGSLNIYLLITIAIYSMMLELRNEIEDLNIDKEAGYQTTVVKLGYKQSIKLLECLFIVFVLISLLSLNKVHPLIIVLLVIYSIEIINMRLSLRYKVRLMDLYAITYYLIILIVNTF